MNLKKTGVLFLVTGLAACAAACGNGKEEEEAAQAMEQQESGEGQQTDMEPEEEPREESEDADPAQENPGGEEVNDNENRKDQYMSVLLAICTENKLPDGSALAPLEEGSGKMSDNRFAVYDIDGDGKRELLIQYVTGPTAGMMELICDYDAETKGVREQLREYPLLTYYDNGMIEAGWSHNQGLSGDALWPYTLWQYNPEEDVYDAVADVEAWDREISETDQNWNISFPEETDADGDGIVYYVRPKGVSDYVAPIDGPEYEQWRNSCLEGAKTVDVVYEELTEQNIYMIE